MSDGNRKNAACTAQSTVTLEGQRTQGHATSGVARVPTSSSSFVDGPRRTLWAVGLAIAVGACAGGGGPSQARDASGRTPGPRDAQISDDASRASPDVGAAFDAGTARDAGRSSDALVADVPPVTGEILRLRDLAYPPPSGVTSNLATLDLFRRDDGQVRPLVLLVHGGSWAGGDKAGFEVKFAPWWIDRGYVAAPVNFRLASMRGVTPVVKPQDQARDIAAALAWLLSNAQTYGIATEKVVLVGYSSGAHLVALLGTDERYLREAGVDETKVVASISLDVHVYDVPYALGLMVGSVVERNIPIIRHLFGQTEAEQLTGSPINYLDGWAASAFIVSVDQDPMAPGTHGYIVSQAAQRYVTALRAAGHKADTLHESAKTHSELVNEFGDPGDTISSAIETYLTTLP